MLHDDDADEFQGGCCSDRRPFEEMSRLSGCRTSLVGAEDSLAWLLRPLCRLVPRPSQAGSGHSCSPTCVCRRSTPVQRLSVPLSVLSIARRIGHESRRRAALPMAVRMTYHLPTSKPAHMARNVDARGSCRTCRARRQPSSSASSASCSSGKRETTRPRRAPFIIGHQLWASAPNGPLVQYARQRGSQLWMIFLASRLDYTLALTYNSCWRHQA